MSSPAERTLLYVLAKLGFIVVDIGVHAEPSQLKVASTAINVVQGEIYVSTLNIMRAPMFNVVQDSPPLFHIRNVDKLSTVEVWEYSNHGELVKTSESGLLSNALRTELVSHKLTGNLS